MNELMTQYKYKYRYRYNYECQQISNTDNTGMIDSILYRCAILSP